MGTRIVKCLGLVRGLTVRTKIPAGNDRRRGVRTFFGGRAGIFNKPLRVGSRGGVQLMPSHARDMGADTVVGIRYDTGPMVGAAEVLCYGTARPTA